MATTTGKRLSWTGRLGLVLLGLLLTVITGEATARIWVACRWPAERVELLTTHSTVRGRFASHPYLPFVLNPAWEGHNGLGFRGAEITPDKPAGVRRVACVGASTTYGLHLSPLQAYPGQLEKLLGGTHGAWQAINAGVPGWVSTEILINLQLRVLPLQPDVVVILEGRNEILPQAYDAFRADYTHFRRPGFNYAVSNYGHKQVFAWSHLAMLLCTVRGGRFGWQETAEHPLYGGIVWENRPTVDAAIRNLQEPQRSSTLMANLEGMVALCRARGIAVVLVTMAFRPDKLALDELDRDPRLHEVLGRQVERNNQVARDVATRFGARVVDGATLRDRPELFFDDCHMNAEGHALLAQKVYDAIAADLAARR